jgi:hypothetical protein
MFPYLRINEKLEGGMLPLSMNFERQKRRTSDDSNIEREDDSFEPSADGRLLVTFLDVVTFDVVAVAEFDFNFMT